MAKYFVRRLLLFVSFCFYIVNGSAQSVGGNTSGGKIYCDTSNSGFLSLNNFIGTIITWEYSTDSIHWTATNNTISPQSYYHLKQTTWYRAIVKDGAFPPDTSTVSQLTIFLSAKGGVISGGGVFCGSSGAGALNLSGNVGSVLFWQYSINGGNSWITETNTSTVLNYTNITKNTLYEAVVQTNIACPVDTSAKASFVFSPSIAGTLSGGGTFCKNSGIGTLHLSGYTGKIINWQFSINNGATWTLINDTTNQLNYSNITKNTLYEAVVQLGTCPSDSSNRVGFVFTPSVAGTLSRSDTVCYGVNQDTILLSGNIGKVKGWLSSNNDGATWIVIADTTKALIYFNLTKTILYKAIVKNDSCADDTTASVVIKVLPLPIVSAGNDTIIFKGESVKLKGIGSGSPLWTTNSYIDSVAIFTPSVSPDQSSWCFLTVKDSNSCVNKDSVFITVTVKQFNGIVTNLFTPNGDGINDTWYIQDIFQYPDNEVSVYNIYGDLVFSKKGYANDWQGTYNGSALPDGTYYYIVKFDNSDKKIKGSLDIFKNK